MDFLFKRSYCGPLKAVIFDWAGTVNDYGCFAPAAVFMEVFKEHGVEITMEQARGPMGAAKWDHILQIAQMPEVTKQWASANGRPCSEVDIDTMYQEFIPKQIAVLPYYADLLPGTLETVRQIRNMNLLIGSCTGYNREMLEVCVAEARQRGFVPDSAVSATDVPMGRPSPWMAIQAAMLLNVYPMEACVKVGDTLPDIGEGLNAGMWTIGLAVCGNEFGMTHDDVLRMSEDDKNKKREQVYAKMRQAGAHYVVDSIEDILPILEAIQKRILQGERP